ncbi:MAG: flagellar basal body-associated FliL family protein [Candidatus Delongbacteria bacterium]
MVKKVGLVLGMLVIQGALVYFLIQWLGSSPTPAPGTEQVEEGHGKDEKAGHGKESGKGEDGEKKEKNYEFGAVHAIPDLIINPKGSAGRRVFKISLSLEYDPNNPELAKELEERTPFMRDYLISYLGSMNEDSLSDISYRETIRDSLSIALNRFLSDGGVDRVLFQDFIRQ